MRYRASALPVCVLVTSLIVSGGCISPVAPSAATGDPPTATASATARTSPVGAASPSATAIAGARWTGIYYRLADSATPMMLGGRLQLVAAEARFPGRVMHPDLTWWGANIPRWSPDGSQVLLRDRDSTVYVGSVTSGFQSLPVGRLGPWDWISTTEIATIHQRGGGGAPLENTFVRADVRTGRITHERQVPLGVTMSGTFSPDGKWLVYAQVGPHRPMPTYSFELATQRQIVLSDAAVPAGWVADGRAVLSGDDGVVESVAPDGQRRERIFTGASRALAEPHTNVVVVIARDQGVWTVRSGASPIRTPIVAPAEGFQLHSLSQDADWASFTQSLPRPFPDIGSAKAGVLHFQSGRITYACDRDCQWLAIR